MLRRTKHVRHHSMMPPYCDGRPSRRHEWHIGSACKGNVGHGATWLQTTAVSRVSSSCLHQGVRILLTLTAYLVVMINLDPLITDRAKEVPGRLVCVSDEGVRKWVGLFGGSRWWILQERYICDALHKNKPNGTAENSGEFSVLRR